jgi:DNA mismatch repair ATPase MutS
MSVIVPESSEQDFSQEIVYLYKLQSGISEFSLGIECALSAGISKEICERAKSIRESIMNQKVIFKS